MEDILTFLKENDLKMTIKLLEKENHELRLKYERDINELKMENMQLKLKLAEKL